MLTFTRKEINIHGFLIIARTQSQEKKKQISLTFVFAWSIIVSFR